uniref:Uncharacterized protein n=1 Tax=Pipistrellus kuhlii TaxID=59472 RepID=A0A7J7V662_PIPKU|nr:hypothetical protein mPipKuh1_008575 [Pipistrellus kuhlii]
MLWILLREPGIFVWRGTHPVASHRGAHELSAGVCAHGPHSLDQSDCGVPPVLWRNKSQFLLHGMCTLGWICMPNCCLQRCTGAVCWGSGLRKPLCHNSTTVWIECQWLGLCLAVVQRGTQGTPARTVGSVYWIGVIQQIIFLKSWSFERINKINVPLARLTKKQGESTQINKISNESSEVTVDSTDIQNIIKKNTMYNSTPINWMSLSKWPYL